MSIEHPVKKGRLKRIAFRLVLLTPLLLLLLIPGALAVRLIQVRQMVDYEAYLEGIQDILTRRLEHPFHIEGADGVGSFANHEGPPAYIQIRPGDRVVYVFGGSSPLFPEGDNFPLHLQKLARQKKLPLSVVNFSYYGLNSFDLKTRVRTALAWRVPDLVLIYSGHNDYSFCYWNHLLPNFYLVKGAPILEFVSGAALDIFKLLSVFYDDPPAVDESAVRIALFEPALQGWAQRYGLLSLSREMFQQVDQVVEAHFRKNLGSIIGALEAADVPVVLMTTLSNLHHPPVGIDGDAEECFEAGVDGEPHSRHVPLLLQARDADRFSGFIRAKSPLQEVLRSLPGEAAHVSVLDLERAFLGEGAHLDSRLFSDAIHLTPELHRKVAGEILEHIGRRRLIKWRESGGGTQVWTPTAVTPAPTCRANP